MHPTIFATLCGAIENWMSNHCEDSEWPDTWFPEDLAIDMAKSARLVFDASIKSSEFTQGQIVK